MILADGFLSKFLTFLSLIKSDELKSILKSLDPNKSTGLDRISPKMFKLASDVLLPSLLQCSTDN